jgi:hypothetical protein
MDKVSAKVTEMTRTTQDWQITLGFQLADDEALRPGDKRVPMLGTWLAKEYGGRATATPRGWTATVVVPAGPEVHFIDEAEKYGTRLIDEFAQTVGLPKCAIVSRSVIDADTYVAELEVVGNRELARLLGVSRQRLAQLRAEGTLPEPDAQLAATPVWKKETVDGFVWGWRRRPGPVPRALDFHMD